MADILIRPFVAGDADAVRRVVGAAFHPGNEAELVERMRASDHYVAAMELVAVNGEEITGHVMVSGTSIIDRTADTSTISMLSPLAVAPERQREGIGGTLVRAVSEIADRFGEPEAAQALRLSSYDPSDVRLRKRVTYPPAFDGFS